MLQLEPPENLFFSFHGSTDPKLPLSPMSDTSKFNPIVSFLWSIADLLNGAFKKSEFQKIVLPFTVLRRLDAVRQN